MVGISTFYSQLLVTKTNNKKTILTYEPDWRDLWVEKVNSILGLSIRPTSLGEEQVYF